MKLSDIAGQLRGSLIGEDAVFSTLSTDSRTLEAGQLFVALRGENFDGHNYASVAQEKGACAAVVDHPVNGLAVAQIVVPDTTKALGQIGAINRDLFTGKVLALTGSSGKTTVKGMLAEICQFQGTTIATAGNLNNHIGVPLTLMQLHDQEFAIIEAGTSGIGEIAYLTDLIQPDIALVNNVMAAHLGGFGALDAIAAEKSGIYGGTRLATAVINLDDNYCDVFLRKIKGMRTIGFTLNVTKVADAAELAAILVGEKLQRDEQGCYQFALTEADTTCVVRLGVPGQHNVNNALAAAAAARAFDIPLEAIARGLSRYAGTPGRMQVLPSTWCKQLINDTYNANPGSMAAAIDFLAGASKSVLVMGDMGELGENAAFEHRKIGEYARVRGVSSLWAIGELSREAVTAFAGEAHWFESKASLADALSRANLADAVVLVKGSRSAKMEEVLRLLDNNNEVAPC